MHPVQNSDEVVVRWICAFEFGNIRHVPCVTMFGHAKDSTREEWESVFADERRGVEYDMTGRVAQILSMPSLRL